MDSKVALDVQVVATGLDSPWGFELLPDGRYLVSERPGNLRIVGADGTVSAPVKGLPPVQFEGQGGLLDVALDPQYASNKTVYWSYSEPRDGGNGTALAKGTLVEDAGGARLENVKVLFQQMPTFASALHFGSRIAFSQDGKLFLALGERALPAGMVQSQDLNSHFGKVVRLNLDGSVPADNPFVGRSDAKPQIWSYGHRNVQAATFDSATGKLWTIEHGPRGPGGIGHGDRDEIAVEWQIPTPEVHERLQTCQRAGDRRIHHPRTLPVPSPTAPLRADPCQVFSGVVGCIRADPPERHAYGHGSYSS